MNPVPTVFVTLLKLIPVTGVAVLSAPIRSATSPLVLPETTLPLVVVAVVLVPSATLCASAFAVGTSSTIRITKESPLTVALPLSVMEMAIESVLSIAVDSV